MITNTNKYKKKRLYTLILLLSLFSVSFLTLGIDFLNTGVIDQENTDEDTGSVFNPVTSAGIGEDQWWNESYQWRQCLNITNPGSFDLKNNIIKYSLNYNTLSDVQSDLDDVRIVENGILRKYYMKIDYPKTDYVTIWFETNVSAGATDYDTYIYYGNSSVGRADSYYLENCPEGIAQWNFDYDDPANSFVNETLSNLYHGELSSQMDSNNYITGKWGNGIQIDMSETAGDGEYIALNMSYTTGTATAPTGYEPTNLHGYISEFTASAWV
ncbi:MAG: hypothetical protein GF317_12150, partial [Candidatus Lokiarchaeota archaeon]|nr:hypothetical protein [Candidatus Lokiarchaeota archaeon]MBD3200399.1 hypothetical protein [Candidatus Lokiarchaeota archaeon]